MNPLKEKITSKKAVVGVIGLGYVGLSLLDAFAQGGFRTIGFDIDKKKIEMLKSKKSYFNFMDLKPLFKLLDKKRFTPSSDPSILKKADILVISVPTTLDRHQVPDLTNLKAAFKTVLANLKKGQLIVLQSSTYPGTTEEELFPLVKKAGFKVGKDVFIAHVPEVVDIGNHDFTFNQLPRIISGITPACRDLAQALYAQLGCPTVPCSSPKVAESAKLLQNAFRLVNISFINEMKIMFDRMNMDVLEVIEAAKSKPFGFMPFEPGPGVGGDCIPITPFYLVWKAKMTEGPTTLVEQAGHINESMHIYVFNKIVEGLNQFDKSINHAKILVLGVAYKKEINDIRESTSIKLLHLLKEKGAAVEYNDPYVKEVLHPPGFPKLHMKSVPLVYEKLKQYDAIVIMTDHEVYKWDSIAKNSKLIIDARNVPFKTKDAKKKVIRA